MGRIGRTLPKRKNQSIKENAEDNENNGGQVHQHFTEEISIQNIA